MPALAGAATILAGTAVLTSAYSHLLSAVAGAVALGGFYLIMVLIRPHAIGLGDLLTELVSAGWLRRRSLRRVASEDPRALSTVSGPLVSLVVFGHG
jgi:hypothetical protein